MKPKMGRPPLPKGTTKGVLIGARFAPDEAEQVQNAVKRAKQVKSEWVRTVLLSASKKSEFY
jgi:hypothetical protein